MIIENPFKTDDDKDDKDEEKEEKEEDIVGTQIQGLVLLEGRLVIYSQKIWCIYDMAGNKVGMEHNPAENCILSMKMMSLDTFSILTWSGDENDDSTGLQSMMNGKWTDLVPCHASVTLNKAQTKAFLCDDPADCTVSCYEMVDGKWEKEMIYEFNKENILMLSLSVNEQWCIGTTMKGFRLWSTDGRQSKKLCLPNTVRNVCKRHGVSSNLVLSAQDKYAVAGIRKELYIWNMDTEELSKVNFQYPL